MDHQIKIPDILYERAKHLAAARRQPVEELLADALDLIEKDAASLLDEAEKRMDREEAAFAAQLSNLRQMYLNEFVAIFGGEVVDHDPDEGALLQRIDIRYPNQIVLLKQVIAQPRPIFQMRSPRLIKD
ncbi:MAG: hypothetical protein QNJ45_23925 [Ardenticatenaceae bacterium]|nr:hypothetical protein [Ardenticatenaceae bacterium]